MSDRLLSSALVEPNEHDDTRELETLLAAPVQPAVAAGTSASPNGAVVGEIVGFADGGATPLVFYDGQPGSAALRARTTLDLRAAHIGRDAVLIFEGGDPTRPIVIGCLHGTTSLADVPGPMEVESDGKRLVVTAKEQLVLRCGAASITLTKAGKVIIQGAYISNRSSGALRLKGASVDIN
jgi:hypothetical protein